MAESMRVDWESGTPYFQLIARLVARNARRWGGEPGEALGYVWERLREHRHVGDVIDPRDRILATIVSHKVSNFYRREMPARSRVGRVSLAEIEGTSLARAQSP